MNQRKTDNVRDEFIEVILENEKETKKKCMNELSELFLDIDSLVKKVDEIMDYIRKLLILRKEIDEEEERKRREAEAKKKKKKKKKDEEEEEGDEEEGEDETEEDAEGEEGEEGEEKPKESIIKVKIREYKQKIKNIATIVAKYVKDESVGRAHSFEIFMDAVGDEDTIRFHYKCLDIRLHFFVDKIVAKDVDELLAKIDKIKEGYVKLFEHIGEILSEKGFISFYDPYKLNSIKFIQYYREIENQTQKPQEAVISDLGKEKLAGITKKLNEFYDNLISLLNEFYLNLLDRELLKFIKEHKRLHKICLLDVTKIEKIIQEQKEFIKNNAKTAINDMNIIISRKP